jgi:hypothetical protein
MIDGEGVLEDEHIGDASIEGKLKELLARAQELGAAQRSDRPAAKWLRDSSSLKHRVCC